MRKYGEDEFSFAIIHCSFNALHTLTVMEPHFIRLTDSHIRDGFGYNQN
jgi:hypothetical protein